MRILIVDDDVGTLHTLTVGLTSYGFQVIPAKNGHEALSFIESTNEDPEPVALLVTDLKMPGMDGIELIKKAKGLRPDLLAILITAHGNDDVRTEVRKLKQCGYLEKPFSPHALLEVMKGVMECDGTTN